MICVGSEVRLKRDAPEFVGVMETYRHLWDPASRPLVVAEIAPITAFSHTEDCPVLLPGSLLCGGECNNFIPETVEMLTLTFVTPREWACPEPPAASFPSVWFEPV